MATISTDTPHTHPSPMPIHFTSHGPSKLKQPRKSVATIVLIGETGSGKTTFMSLIINLLRGTNLLEMEDLHGAQNETGLDSSHSQTATATLYTVTTKNGFTLRILDTPGLSDTRGTDHDQRHRASINQAIKDNVPVADAIIIVANGSVQRLSAATKNALDTIFAMFPRSFSQNVGLMFTHCEPGDQNFRLETLPQSLAGIHHWSIQNSLARVKNYRSDRKRLEGLGTSDARRMKIERDFPELIVTLDRWLTWLNDCEAKPTNEINDLCEQYFEINCNIEILLSLLRNPNKRVNGIFCLQESCTSDNCEFPQLNRILESTRWSSLNIGLLRRGGLGSGVAGSGAIIGSAATSASLNVVVRVGAGLVGVGVASAGVATLFAAASMTSWALSAKCGTCGHSAFKHRLSKMSYAPKPGDTTEVRVREIRKMIKELICQYNQIALGNDYAGHLRSAMRYHKELEEGLGPDSSDEEFERVREAIRGLETKLEVLGEQDEVPVQGD